MKETIQDLKIKIETVKKTQTEGNVETEIMRKQSGTTNTSMNIRIQEMEERISNAENILEEIDSSVK